MGVERRWLADKQILKGKLQKGQATRLLVSFLPCQLVNSKPLPYFTNSVQKRSCHNRASATGKPFCMTAKSRR
jgi:hypothetical protein